MAHMKQGRSRDDQPVLACIVDNDLPLPEGWEQMGSFRYLVGARDQAAALGYRLEFFSLRTPGLSQKRLSAILYNRGINGILIGAMSSPSTRLDIHWENFSTVAVGHSLLAPRLHRVSNHQLHSMRLCYQRSRELGYRRLGLAITEKLDNRTDHNLRAAFLAEQSLDRDGERVDLFILQQDETPGGTRFKQWLGQYRPDAVIYAGGGLEAKQWVAEEGLRVPDEIGLINAGLASLHGETGLYQQMETVGAAGIDLLIAEIYGNRYGIPASPKLVLLEGLWHEGYSTRRLVDGTRSSQ